MKRAWLLGLSAALAAIPLFFAGCEVESSADVRLALNPVAVTLRRSESAVFTVSGGYDYRWWLKDETAGSLNRRTGNQVVYTDLSASTNLFVQELYVESFIIGASGNTPTNVIGGSGTLSTNDVQPVVNANAMATAYITHQP